LKRIDECALTLAVSGKIKSQDRESGRSQIMSHLLQHAGMTGAGEAVADNDPPVGRLFGWVQGAGKFFAQVIFKMNLFFHLYFCKT
jgi:hypothetical protein